MKQADQYLEILKIPAEQLDLVTRSPLDDEPRAAHAYEQRQRTTNDALRRLVRAHAGELANRSLVVRNGLHSADAEPNA